MGFIRENILKIITIIIVLIVAILIMIFAFGNKSTTTAKSYPQMEENLKSATKKYVTDNQKLLPKNENETTKINLDTLVDSKYIKELYSIDDSNVKCNGYVSILKKNSKYKLIPYIKCGKYYETVSISNYIKKNDIVTSGDGLYEVGNKYIFKGENPKNYISIGNRLYRIIEIINYGKNTLKLDGKVNNDNIIGLVEFKNVSFKYNELPTLKNISFVAKPNQVTVIVGKTGTGKTTIFNLLLKMYKIDSGKILIDNLNIYDYSKGVYNSNISIVNQKTFIFNMSIRANLSFIDSNKKRQMDACKRVGIHDFIMSLPEGYNTILKEDATNISGGQKQLLSIARALLTTSEILLLDEITSSLDPNTTEKIINLLDDLKSDHTLIVITHNKDLMKAADNLIVLNKGKIECIGKHDALIKNNEIYKQLNSIVNN